MIRPRAAGRTASRAGRDGGPGASASRVGTGVLARPRSARQPIAGALPPPTGLVRPLIEPPTHYGLLVATWQDVRDIALGLPEVVEGCSGRHDVPEWRVRNKLFAWQRPLRKADLEVLGGASPVTDPLAARVPDLVAKEALLADDPGVYFTTPHFDGHPSILVRLERIDVQELRELLVEAWLAQAPKRLAEGFLEADPEA